jgi:nucleoside-diphosphate-sugar epimerase
VAGKRKGICTEPLRDTADFNNVYEETKHTSETLVDRICSRERIRFNIYRPSIVYGDSRSGRSFRFNALYYPIKLTHYLRDLYLRDIQENGGKNAADMGVYLKPGGVLHLPIRVENHRGRSLDVIPIDFFTEAVMVLMERSLDGDIFHIVGRKKIRLDHIITFINRYFNIEGIRPVPRKNFLDMPKNPLEILVGRHLEVYEPYMKDLRNFDQRNSRAILDKADIVCPDFDYAMFDRCVSYALETDWGKNYSVSAA